MARRAVQVAFGRHGLILRCSGCGGSGGGVLGADCTACGCSFWSTGIIRMEAVRSKLGTVVRVALVVCEFVEVACLLEPLQLGRRGEDATSVVRAAPSWHLHGHRLTRRNAQQSKHNVMLQCHVFRDCYSLYTHCLVPSSCTTQAASVLELMTPQH